jgi:hypothetical protein
MRVKVPLLMQFAAEFPDKKIVSPLSTQLTWTHFIELLPIKTQEARLFYANLAISEGLNKMNLRRQIETKAFERTQIANTQISGKSKIPLNTFKDPYLFDCMRRVHTQPFRVL